MAKLTYQQLIDRHLEILRSLQYDSGLFSASDPNVSTGYDKSWLRDNFYETIAFEVLGDWDTVEKTYKAILDIFLKHESKIDWAIENKPTESFQYIHARFHPETFDEFWESWGNKQNDAVGCILFRIGELEVHHRRGILKDPNHVRIVNKLVRYLEAIEYWKDRDSGMWEEDEELHASSVGACVAGLTSVARLENVDVKPELIVRGKQALNDLLPRESARKFVDLALLSLIWPYEVVTKEQEEQILENVEYHLLKERGVIRYKGDQYYNKNPDTISEEAEWTFGLAWLAIIYEKRGESQKAFEYIKDLIAADTPQGIPELYFSNSPEFNDNTPLGWSESLFITALYEVEREKKSKNKKNESLTGRPLLEEDFAQIEKITFESLHARLITNFSVPEAIKNLITKDGQIAFAVDMGGDKIAEQPFQARNGEMVPIGEESILKSDSGRGYMEFLERIADRALIRSYKVGVSVAGPLSGTVLEHGPNIGDFFDEFEKIYRRDFARLFDKPVVSNDAVAGLISGALQIYKKSDDIQNVLFLIAGSGLGGALLKGNEIFSLEPGHVSLEEGLNAFNITDKCGVFENEASCIEKIAAGRAGIEKNYERITGCKKNGHEIADLSLNGDDVALSLYDHSARMISIAVNGIFKAFSIDNSYNAIVFHGGVFDAPGYMERVEQYLARDFRSKPMTLYTNLRSVNACLEGAGISALLK